LTCAATARLRTHRSLTAYRPGSAAERQGDDFDNVPLELAFAPATLQVLPLALARVYSNCVVICQGVVLASMVSVL
jgi:hypothetical protein